MMFIVISIFLLFVNLQIFGIKNLSFEIVVGLFLFGVFLDILNCWIFGIVLDEDVEYIFIVRVKIGYGKFVDVVFWFDFYGK